MGRRTIPNFFIVGAPKCGTTALYTYLSERQDVFMPDAKEPHFFARELPSRCRNADTLAEYLALFEGATSSHVAVGEASVLYVSSPVALDNIRRFAPAAKVIAMLRDPVDMAYSYHAQLVYTLHEDVRDFRTAWDLQGVRRKGERVPATCDASRMLQYREVCSLGTQVETLLNVFPPDQVKLVLFDDFARDTRAAYRSVLAFLGLCDDGRQVFRKVNASKRFRSPLLQRFVMRKPERLRGAIQAFKQALGLRRIGLTSLLHRLNRREFPREPLSPDFARELRDAFRPEVEKLSGILGRDLSHWLAEPEHRATLERPLANVRRAGRRAREG